MDVFYEESSIARNTKSESIKYKIVNVFSKIFLVLGILAILFGFSFIPLNMWLGWGILCLWFFLSWFILHRLKGRFNVSYDYAFVSGELRISKVINVNKRRLVTRIDADEFIQLGDVENTAFEGFRADPNTKTIYCTSNDTAADGKFFMYILANDNGKKLYVLECREELLVHILKFVKRTTLESDYVSQEKKKARI